MYFGQSQNFRLSISIPKNHILLRIDNFTAERNGGFTAVLFFISHTCKLLLFDNLTLLRSSRNIAYMEGGGCSTECDGVACNPVNSC